MILAVDAFVHMHSKLWPRSFQIGGKSNLHAAMADTTSCATIQKSIMGRNNFRNHQDFITTWTV